MNAVLNTIATVTRTLTAPNGKTITTDLTYNDAIALLARHDSPFAGTLIRAIAASRCGGAPVTKNQAIYVYILAEEVRAAQPADMPVAEPVAAPAPLAPPAFPAIHAMFAGAALRGAVRLRVRMNIEGTKIIVKNASANGRNAGSLYVYSADATDAWGEPVYFGKIAGTAGVFHPVAACNGDVFRALEIFDTDPIKAAREYGQKTGECCFCGRFLCDDSEGGSVTVGYGPKCAKRFGLQHSANSKTAAV